MFHTNLNLNLIVLKDLNINKLDGSETPKFDNSVKETETSKIKLNHLKSRCTSKNIG